MRLSCRPERLFDADVELAAAAEREPDAAARAERRRLLDLFQAQQLAEETARLGFTTRWRRELDVI